MGLKMPEKKLNILKNPGISDDIWDFVVDEINDSLFEYAAMLQCKSDESAKKILLENRKTCDDWIAERNAERGRDFYDER